MEGLFVYTTALNIMRGLCAPNARSSFQPHLSMDFSSPSSACTWSSYSVAKGSLKCHGMRACCRSRLSSIFAVISRRCIISRIMPCIMFCAGLLAAHNLLSWSQSHDYNGISQPTACIILCIMPRIMFCAGLLAAHNIQTEAPLCKPKGMLVSSRF